MTKCKKCKAVISLSLADLLTGECKSPKRIAQENNLYCDECFKGQIDIEMNKRSLEYEKKIRAYLFKGSLSRHKAICENLNVKPNIL